MAGVIELEIIEGLPEDFDTAPVTGVLAALNEQADQLGLPAGQVNAVFVDDEMIRQVNRDQAGNDYATDVLSFSYIEDGQAIEGVIGEMLVSLETAQRQADQAGTSLETEVALLILHGILHICGHDHQTDAQRDELEAIQRAIMSISGLTYRDFQWEK